MIRGNIQSSHFEIKKRDLLYQFIKHSVKNEAVKGKTEYRIIAPNTLGF
jgi:hypothetical protein